MAGVAVDGAIAVDPRRKTRIACSFGPDHLLNAQVIRPDDVSPERNRQSMPLYMAVHAPQNAEETETVHKPTDLHGLALEAGDVNASPRWIKAYSPDLHDDRIFTLWESDDAESIRQAMKTFGFLQEMETTVFQVTEWGPDDVLTTELGPS